MLRTSRWRAHCAKPCKHAAGGGALRRVLEEASTSVKEALCSRKAREGWDTGAAKMDEEELKADESAEQQAAERWRLPARKIAQAHENR